MVDQKLSIKDNISPVLKKMLGIINNTINRFDNLKNCMIEPLRVDVEGAISSLRKVKDAADDIKTLEIDALNYSELMSEIPKVKLEAEALDYSELISEIPKVKLEAEALNYSEFISETPTIKFKSEVEPLDYSEIVEEVKTIKIDWEVPERTSFFDTTGIERYKQEIFSASEMINNLIDNQNNISAAAQKIDILPDKASVDLAQMQARLSKVSQTITELSNKRLSDVNADKVNNTIESLRNNLNGAINAQNRLNAAMSKADITQANIEYMELNEQLEQAERNIRDNIKSQSNFNNSVDEGSNKATKLLGLLGKFATAIGIKTVVEKTVDLSDQMTQTTARLDLIVDDNGSVEDLKQKIFNSAQASRGDYLALADTVAKLSLNAKDVFTSNDETIAFVEQLNKRFIIAGASADEVKASTLQLTQALSSGVLRGDELNSVFEQAPNVVQAIADYIDKDIGEIRNLASEGKITADIVKNALLASAEETNETFNNMPKTFAQVMTSLKNQAVRAFNPVLEVIKNIVNSEKFTSFSTDIVKAMYRVSAVLSTSLEYLVSMAGVIYDNWSVLISIFSGLAIAVGLYTAAVVVSNAVNTVNTGIHTAQAIAFALKNKLTVKEAADIKKLTIAQWASNAALLACPITWIIAGIIAVIAIIYAVVAAINKVTGSVYSATGIICGVLNVAKDTVINTLLGMLEAAFTIINLFTAPFQLAANFIQNVFKDPITAVALQFQQMADGILENVQKAAQGIDFIMKTDTAKTVQGWRDELKNSVVELAESRGVDINDFKTDVFELSLDKFGLEYKDVKTSYSEGYNFGKGLDEKISNFGLEDFFKDITSDMGSIEDLLNGIEQNTKNTSEDMELSEEDLKFMRDMAEMKYINRFTTAEVKVEMTNNNNISSGADFDGIIKEFIDKVDEASQIIAEGEHI